MSWWPTFAGASNTPASITISGSTMGSELMELLTCDSIVPGAPPSYEICKVIYTYHPLGKKIADTIVSMAMSKPREITVLREADGPIVKQFTDTWTAMGIDAIIANVKGQSRVYGAAGVGVMVEGWAPTRPLKLEELTATTALSFNIWDPLNLSGSLVTNQNPNSPAFQKTEGGITAGGVEYHSSRTHIVLNEQPLYIDYTISSFGYVGRSIYQRALFPLKSFIQTQITNDLISKKAGVLIAKIRQAGSVTDNVQASMVGTKRQMVQSALTGNVISVAPDEGIETLNMINIDGAGGFARKNILEDISSATDQHPWFLSNDSFAEGFGEGEEDANAVIGNVNRVRKEMEPIYRFFDQIVMRRAWTREFFLVMQTEQADVYGSLDYETAFYKWANSFTAGWPNLIEESDEEKAKSAKVVVDAVKAISDTLLPILDPDNKATVVAWIASTLNQMKEMFPVALVIDEAALAAYEPPVGEPAAKADAARRRVA